MKETVRTILIVDDEKNIQDLLKDALSAGSRRILIAATIAETREVLAREKPDLLILDRMLPDGDGLDFCSELRKDPANDNTRILIFSARTDNADKLRAFSWGADGYVGKPCDMPVMQGRVEDLLASAGGA